MAKTKTIALVLLCLCLACQPFFMKAQAAVFSDYAMVTADRALLLSDPSANSSLSGSLRITEVVRVLDQKESGGVVWFQVETQGGQRGYVTAASLRILTTAEAALLDETADAAPSEILPSGPFPRGGGTKYVTFGEYPYDGWGNPQPILWRVLSVNQSEALLMSEYLLDCCPYSYQEAPAGSAELLYENSEIYRFLNEEFQYSAFSQAELGSLLHYKNMGRVFILSVSELTNTAYGFIKSKDTACPARAAIATPYAEARGVFRDAKAVHANYWIATLSGQYVCMGRYTGTIGRAKVTRENIGLRVSVLVDVESLYVTSGSGTQNDPCVLRSVY